MTKDIKRSVVFFIKKSYFFLRFLISCFTGRKIPLINPKDLYSPEYCLDIRNEECDNKAGELPKIIWMYWDDPFLDEYLNKLVVNISELNPTYSVKLLNKKNFNAYLPYLKFNDSVNLSSAHKSDVIRLCLLRDYGGVWIDISTIFFEDLSWVENSFKRYDYDVVGFFRKVSTCDFNKPIIENWFLASRPGNKFIKHWLSEFYPIISLGSDSYYKKLKERGDFSEIKQLVDNPGYLLSYLAAQIVMNQHPDRFSFFLRCCEENAFFYQRLVSWKPHLVTYLLARVESLGVKPEIIKLTKSDRLLFKWVSCARLIKKRSILFFLK